MAIWLGAWAGDEVGQQLVRQPNRLLLSLTHTDGTFPSAVHQHGEFQGVEWYYELYVTCLTPGMRPAIAIGVEDVGDYVWSVELAEVDWGDTSLGPWSAGVHLFSAMMLGGGGSQSGVIGTAVIDADVRRIDASANEPELNGFPGEWGDWYISKPAAAGGEEFGRWWRSRPGDPRGADGLRLRDPRAGRDR